MKDYLLVNQTVYLLKQISESKHYIGFQTEQPEWAPTKGYDYSFICPTYGVVVKITDFGIYIKENCKMICKFPVSGNYVAIQEMCKRLMVVATITETTEHIRTDSSISKTIRFEKK
jgi:hypothetical protein